MHIVIVNIFSCTTLFFIEVIVYKLCKNSVVYFLICIQLFLFFFVNFLLESRFEEEMQSLQDILHKGFDFRQPALLSSAIKSIKERIACYETDASLLLDSKTRKTMRQQGEFVSFLILWMRKLEHMKYWSTTTVLVCYPFEQDLLCHDQHMHSGTWKES